MICLFVNRTNVDAHEKEHNRENTEIGLRELRRIDHIEIIARNQPSFFGWSLPGSIRHEDRSS